MEAATVEQHAEDGSDQVTSCCWGEASILAPLKTISIVEHMEDGIPQPAAVPYLHNLTQWSKMTALVPTGHHRLTSRTWEWRGRCGLPAAQTSTQLNPLWDPLMQYTPEWPRQPRWLTCSKNPGVEEWDAVHQPAGCWPAWGGGGGGGGVRLFGSLTQRWGSSPHSTNKAWNQCLILSCSSPWQLETMESIPSVDK